MQIKFDVGAELDIATKGEIESVFDKNKPAKGRAFDITGSNILPSGIPGDMVIRLGRPPTGSVWNIVYVTVMGADDHSTVAGKQALYLDVDVQNLNLACCKIPGITAPFNQPISKGTLWAHASGDVALNVTSSGGAQVLCTVSVVEYNWFDVFENNLR